MLANQLARRGVRTWIPKPSFFLVRPDGYIGFAGRRLDIEALKRYEAERLVVRGAAR